MNRRPDDIKNKNTNLHHLDTNSSRIKKAISMNETTLSMFVTKLPLQQANRDRQIEETKKSSLNTTQPLTFSTRSNLNKRQSVFCQSNLSNVKSKQSNLSNFIQNINLQCKQTKQSDIQKQKIKKELEQLKQKYQLVVNNLNESKRSFQSLNSAYETKCQQVQTLKSIINSIKDYVFRQEKLTPIAQSKQEKTDQIIQKPVTNSYKRKTSLNTHVMDSKESENEFQKKVLMKLQEYAHMKLVQSIKGSFNELYSYNLL